MIRIDNKANPKGETPYACVHVEKYFLQNFDKAWNEYKKINSTGWTIGLG